MLTKRITIYASLLLLVCLHVPMPAQAERQTMSESAMPQAASSDSKSAGRTPVYQGFSGGMMVHLGYLYGRNSTAPMTMNGGTMGIGGAARVHLWQHLRVGGEGYVSTLPVWMSCDAKYLQPGSYVRNGWGGVLADAYWKCGKLWPFVGATIGGGAQRSLYIIEGSETDWQEESRALFNRQTYFMLDPFVGLEIGVSAHMHLTLRLDYVLPIQRTGLVSPHGPRVYIGMMFCH